MPYIALYFTAFYNNCCLIISQKNTLLPQIIFLDSISPDTKISFFPIVTKYAKILCYM